MIESTIEYRVRPVTRYIITRFEEYADEFTKSGLRELGEYNNDLVAYEVAYALCKAEHERLGYAPGDEHIQYPKRPEERGGACGAIAVPKQARQTL